MMEDQNAERLESMVAYPALAQRPPRQEGGAAEAFPGQRLVESELAYHAQARSKALQAEENSKKRARADRR